MKTSLLNESVAIFRRNPLTTTTVVLLITAASVGQVVSLGSLFPILQVLLSGEPDSTNALSGTVLAFLRALGITTTLGNLIIFFVLLGVGYSVLNWFAETFQGLHLRNFETTIRYELLDAAVMADWRYTKGLRHGEFLNVITREATQYKYVVKYCLLTVGSMFQFTALIAYALYLDWRLTLLGMLFFGSGSVILIPILRSGSQHGQQGTQIAGNMSNRLVAALRSLKTVKALSLEPFLLRTLKPSFHEFASNYFNQNVLSSGQYAIMEIVAFAAVSSMLYAGLSIFAVPRAELFIILILLFRALPQARIGIDNYHRAYSYSASVETVRRHLTEARSARESRLGLSITSNWQEIEFRNVTFAYEHDISILDRLSTRIKRREFWAVLGPSGSGKTTFLDLMLGLLKPRNGLVTIDGVDLNTIDLSSWHSQVAYLGQEPFVFAGTLRENLVWGTDGHIKDAELAEILNTVKLSEALDKDVGENGCNLSGGEKQRLALARLFLRRPTVVVLDEPTTGLDSVTETDIFNTILNHFRDATLIVVTHREELVRGADHVIRFSTNDAAIESRKQPAL